MNTAIVCNTPYQLYNSVNMVMNRVGGIDEKTDLFLINRFKDSNILFKKVCNIQIFRKVYYCNINNENRRRLESVKDIIRNHFLFNDYSFLDEEYEQIFIADANEFGILLAKYNNGVNIHLYDDGIASYYGNILLDYVSTRFKTLKKLLKVGIYGIEPKSIYVNNKKLCTTTSTKIIYELPKPNSKLISVYKDLFSFSENSLIKKKRLIYLDQPYESLTNIKSEIINDVVSVLNRKGAMVRYHPRSTKHYSCMIEDSTANMWELECLENVTDKHVLIAYFSASQFNPKVLSNNEPYLVFLYEILCDDKNEKNEKRILIELLKNTYTFPRKIFVPKNIEDLSDCLDYIKKELSNEQIM